MNATTGHYWLVQYCADLARLETVNVGVVLFVPEGRFLRAAVTSSNRKVTRCFRGEHVDTVQLDALKESVVNGLAMSAKTLKAVDDVDQFLRVRADEILVTPPRTVRVEDAEAALANLLADLVEEPATRATAVVAEQPGLFDIVHTKLTAPDVRENIVENVTVRVPGFRKILTVPVAYQNGRFNLVQPVRFERMNRERVEERASLHALEGRYLFEHPDKRLGEMQLVVVGEFSPAQSDQREIVREILEDNQAKLYTLEQLDALKDDIRLRGKPRPDLLQEKDSRKTVG